MDTLADEASPEKITKVTKELGCRSVAYTYNDPVIFMAYAIDVARECRKHDTDVWLEITTLLIPGLNDSDQEVEEMAPWVVANLGPDVPWHFTAFYPAWKMLDRPPTPVSTVTRTREISMKSGVRYAYTGNVSDETGGSTYCHQCGKKLIGRNSYLITEWHLTEDNLCEACTTPCTGVFEDSPGAWGANQLPVRMKDFVV